MSLSPLLPGAYPSLVLGCRAELLIRETLLPDLMSLSLFRECLLPAIPGGCKKLIPDVRDAMLSDDILQRPPEKHLG